MKKTTNFASFAFALMMLISINVSAQDFKDLDKSPMDGASFPSSYRVSDKLVKVNYGRPQLKGRTLAKLAPNGEVWRTGANEAAEITFYVPMKMGTTMVQPGTYSLFTIPGATEWTVILSKDVNVWGSYSYKKENDVARVTVPATMADKSVEAFSMAFEESKAGTDLWMGWDKVRVKVPFSKSTMTKM
jgi:hypothetical protein